jgi:hypothetical protein
LRHYQDAQPKSGGTCWRITGPSLDEIETRLGVEIYRDHLGRGVVVITVF